MKIVKKEQTAKFENSSQCYGDDYPLNDKDINISVITINGRYPDSGYCINNVCKELIYVLNGTGTLYDDNQQEISFNEHDVLLINPNESYYWIGYFTIATICTPAWYPEQHQFK